MMQSIAALVLGCGKLMHIVIVTSIDWHERRLISEFYMDQRVKLKMDHGGDKKSEDRKRG